MPSSNAVIIIPARYDSQRFPGKPLSMIKGMSLLERVWRIGMQVKNAEQCYIATDDPRIAEHAKSIGAAVIMTSSDCATGTDRVAQAALSVANRDTIVLSLQGDAVLTPPWVVENLITALENSEAGMATPAVAMTGEKLKAFLAHKKRSPSSGTTVVFKNNNNQDKNQDKEALYFSKQPIPFYRDLNQPDAVMYRHIGLYAYRFHTLNLLQSLAPSPLEKIEKLEQLRALENNIPIQVVLVDYQGRSHGSVDTPEDILLIESIINKEGELV